jgi:uncharacterized protein (TIGR02646 family)
MIRIDKPDKPPKILGPSGRGPKKRKQHCDEYVVHPAEYRSGKRTFDFDRSVYGPKSVKNALLKAQCGKCAFCEAKITAVSYGDVEHFRPKAGVKQEDGDGLQRPGYYWLAYDWGNLLASCPLCNRRFKGNLFPLADPKKRARTHNQKLSKESPLLINPAEEDPSPFISFHQEMPFAVGANGRGKATIGVFGLDREALNELRRESLKPLQLLWDLVRLSGESLDDEELQALAEKARGVIDARLQDSAEYAGMVRAAFGG